MDTLQKTLAFCIIAVWAAVLVAAPPVRTHVHVFHGATRPGATKPGFTVQVHAVDIVPTQVRLIHVNTNTVHVVDVANIVALADHSCYVASVPATVFPAAVVGDVARVEVLVGGKWTPLGEVKIRAR